MSDLWTGEELTFVNVWRKKPHTFKKTVNNIIKSLDSWDKYLKPNFSQNIFSTNSTSQRWNSGPEWWRKKYINVNFKKLLFTHKSYINLINLFSINLKHKRFVFHQRSKKKITWINIVFIERWVKRAPGNPWMINPTSNWFGHVTISMYNPLPCDVTVCVTGHRYHWTSMVQQVFTLVY